MAGSPQDSVAGAPPDPASVASGDKGADPLPEGAVLRFGTSRYRPGTHIYSMAVSADGKRAVVGCNNTAGMTLDITVRLIDLVSGEELGRMSPRQDAVVLAHIIQCRPRQAGNAP